MDKRFTFKTFVSEFVLAICTLICLTPILYFVMGAFKDRTDIVKHPFLLTAEMFTTDNFPYVIAKMKYWRALTNTALITVCALIIIVIAASLAGFAVARIRGKIFRGFYGLAITLMVIPFIACVLPLVKITLQFDIYNSVLGCIFIQAAWNLPFAIFLYSGFMQDLPQVLEEAAYIDGCTTFDVYFRIFLPLLTPVTATCCIRSGVNIWNDFLVTNSILNSSKTPTLMVGVNQFFGQYTTEYGYAFAGIVLASIPLMVLFLCLQKYFIKGIAAGAVKG